jgi:hypothetical protein
MGVVAVALAGGPDSQSGQRPDAVWRRRVHEIETRLRAPSWCISRLTRKSPALAQTVRSLIGTACGSTDTVNQVDFPRPPGRFSTPHT